MHQNFFHWHSRAELKPDTTHLEKRWDAATKFAEKLSPSDLGWLIQIALYRSTNPEFTRRFSAHLVKIEPTFPPEKNEELLRIMASATLYSQMEKESATADSIALGLRASAFLPERIQPVSTELMERASEYLASESERIRPAPDLDGAFNTFETAKDDETPDSDDFLTLIANGLLELGQTMRRISEENQFLWWLLGRSSPILKKRREKITPSEYAFAVASEAASRVVMLPPPSCAEALIDEALTHCEKQTSSSTTLLDLISAADLNLLKITSSVALPREIVPLTSLLVVRRDSGKVVAKDLQNLKMPTKFKLSPNGAANQFFHELMFFRSIEELG